MSFNLDLSKQAQDVIFFCKIKKPIHPVLIFNNNQVIQTPYQKHIGLFLDEKLNFGEHLRYMTNKVNTSIGLLRKLQKCLPRRSLVTIYKSFIRPVRYQILTMEMLSLIRRIINLSMKAITA